MKPGEHCLLKAGFSAEIYRLSGNALTVCHHSYPLQRHSWLRTADRLTLDHDRTQGGDMRDTTSSLRRKIGNINGYQFVVRTMKLSPFRVSAKTPRAARQNFPTSCCPR
jgi:hypothetical protein